MAQVNLRINGYSHQVACADGEEDHLKAMGSEIDSRIGALRQAGLAGGETKMLVLTALQLADELADARRALGKAEAPPPAAPAASAPSPEMVAAMAALAERIGRVAGKLETAALENKAAGA
jgi:cell division protein ZapA